MKKILSASVFMILVLAFASSQSAEQKPDAAEQNAAQNSENQEASSQKITTLEEYLLLVKENNKDLKIASQNARIAKQKAREALALILPTAGISGNYTRNLLDVEQLQVVGSRYLPQPVNYNGTAIYPAVRSMEDSNYDNELTLGAQVNLSIYDPANHGKVRLANKSYDIQQQAEILTEEMLVLNAKKLYAQVQLVESVKKVQEETRDNAKAVYENQKLKYAQGTVTELDMRLAEVDFKNAETDLAVAEKNFSLIMLALKTLAGIPTEEELNISQSTSPDVVPQEKLELSDVLSKSTEYKIQLMSKEISSIQFSNSLTAFLPSISGSFGLAKVNYSGHDTLDDLDFWAMTLGVKVTFPVLTGGYRPAVVKEASLSKQKSALEVAQKRDEIEQKIEAATLRLDESAARIESAAALEDAATRAAELARTALKNGLGTQITVSTAETQLSKAKLSMQNAIYEYKSALYDFEYLQKNTEE